MMMPHCFQLLSFHFALGPPSLSPHETAELFAAERYRLYPDPSFHYPTLPYPTLPYPTLPYPTLPYPI